MARSKKIVRFRELESGAQRPHSKTWRNSGAPAQSRERFGVRPLRAAVECGEDGFILLGVLILVMLISMVALSLMFRLRADETAASATSGGDQAFAAAMTGVQEAMRVVKAIKPGLTDWEDDPRTFRERLVYNDGSDKWYFTIWSPGDKDHEGEVLYGLTDEARKVNVNSFLLNDLTKIPNMTTAMAAAVKDYTDFDDAVRPEGAEQEYYNGLPQPYTIRNGPLPTLDSLLLVRGFTPELLYGEDANMNLRLDPNENDGDERPPADNGDGNLDMGFKRFLTVHSSDPNTDNDGVPRTNLNDPNDPYKGVEYPTALTNFINQLRQANLHLDNVSDLLEAKVNVKDEKGVEHEISSEVEKAELPLALDLFTTSTLKTTDGLININTAPIEVLTTVPGIDEPLAESILSARKSISPEKRGTIAWLFQEDVVDAATFKKIAPFLTARGCQFSFQVVGFGVPSGRFRRLEVVIDSSELTPRVVYLRDLTRLGAPFKLEPETTEAQPQARASGKREPLNRG
jgi:DNA uptake protein ComE-like DNA-binding protein